MKISYIHDGDFASGAARLTLRNLPSLLSSRFFHLHSEGLDTPSFSATVLALPRRRHSAMTADRFACGESGSWALPIRGRSSWVCLLDPPGEQPPRGIAQRLDRHGKAASARNEVIRSELLLRPRVFRLTHVDPRQVAVLLIFEMPGLKGVLGRIAKLADGEAHSFAQLVVKPDSARSILIRSHELPLQIVQEIVRTSTVWITNPRKAQEFLATGVAR